MVDLLTFTAATFGWRNASGNAFQRIRVQRPLVGPMRARLERDGASPGSGVDVVLPLQLLLVRSGPSSVDFVVVDESGLKPLGTAPLPSFADAASLFVAVEAAIGTFGGTGAGGVFDDVVVGTSTCPLID